MGCNWSPAQRVRHSFQADVDRLKQKSEDAWNRRDRIILFIAHAETGKNVSMG